MEKEKKNPFFWKNHAVNQLSFSINLITGISIALLTYLFRFKDVKVESICFDWFSFHPNNIFILCLLLLFLSVFCGILAVLYRLSDGRLSRNIEMVEAEFYKYHGNEIEHIDRSPENRGLKTLLKHIFCGFNIIREEDLRNGFLYRDYHKNRENSLAFGNAAWFHHLFQLLFLSLSLFFLTGLSLLTSF